MRLRALALVLAMLSAIVAVAEVQVINGKRYECKDGMCTLIEETTNAVSVATKDLPRIAQGYMPADKFVAFLENRDVASPFGDAGIWLTLLLVLLGGLTMNLTPCVLPMMPINLMIIGRSAKRGAVYGLGIALAYGALGVAAAFGGLAFGTIQGNPWFNVSVAVVFVILALALFDVFFIDLSRFRPNVSNKGQASAAGLMPAFFMGALSAVLAGACVAPILISVLLLTTDLVAKGHKFAALLPFVMGLGMALPWPFAGAGMKVLPKPGAWMKWVNRIFGLVVLGFASWYGYLAWRGFNPAEVSKFESVQVKDFPGKLAAAKRPVLVDCWATWCKNCAAMDAVLEEPEVRRTLKPFTVIRVQAEDITELRKVNGFESVRGLPAFAIFE